MNLQIHVREPFSFSQTLTFLRRFLPCQEDFVLTADSLTAAVTVAGRAVTFTIREADGLWLACEDALDAPALLARASELIGARDDLASFYATAANDPPMHGLVAELHGLHHVRFLTLEEICVYAVIMQRTPITIASRLKRRFMDRFGLPIEIAGRTLRALPSSDVLGRLDGKAIGEAIGHARKGEVIAEVLRGVAAIGEATLREAPYAEARDALLAIRGIGPFSAAAILLRGLGRMDELPELRGFADTARTLYGGSYDDAAIRARYGRDIGHWAFYLKTGVAQRSDATRGDRLSRSPDLSMLRKCPSRSVKPTSRTSTAFAPPRSRAPRRSSRSIRPT
ncbi:MAG: hypothetical protein H0T89_17935 [Deltaproteobacteria bacterium]|nr:hypothetical protein [Deltaproteobacteria bacterium]MDQ3298135.1 hypothetical protein [Myxococcota bacterium]